MDIDIDTTPNEDYPFISEQSSSMLEGSARFQDAYVLLRLYDEVYEHYLERYAKGQEDEASLAEARQFATFIINKLFGSRG